MTVFVCIEDRGGMLFNKRRLSRDKNLTDDVIRTSDDGVLYVNEFSEELFCETDASVICVPEPMESASDSAYVFAENIPLSKYSQRISKLIIYKWNRRYPFDTVLDIDPEKSGFKLSETVDLVGNSHEKITKEVYVK